MNPTTSLLPPFSEEAEQAILGSIIQDKNALYECQEKLTTEVFYDLRHQSIYETFVQMHEEGIRIDPMTAMQRLRDTGKLEAIGGIGYLSALCDACLSPANIGHWIAVANEKSVLRRMIQVCARITAEAYGYTEHTPLDEFVDRAEADILSVAKGGGGNTQEKTMKDFVRAALERIEAKHKAQGKITGITTGFYDLDRLTRGLKPGVTVIAARPSIGKTSLAMNIVEHVAIDQGLPVGVFSLEMDGTSLTERMICSRGRVDVHHVADGALTEKDMAGISTQCLPISASPICIVEQSSLSSIQLKAKARRLHQRHGVKLFVVDYLQLVESQRRNGDSREQQVSAISRGIKQLSMELDVVIIVLAQLNRDIEKDKNRKPRLSDLRESGSIEQDADNVVLLYKPNSEEDEPEGEVVRVGAILAKHRSGPTGEVELTFFKKHTRFESVSRVQHD